ncbi:MAG: acyl-ACP--UDP-N-acetylglucosamine O-acyltransferase [Pseudomonadota bacterium]|uniref:Acyl-[acyl-carrier-protein]--UDP-N-acetylglucosamine O-acyltransferase n=1 Tax=Alteromonas genovensis TaxID=471225 RepID=A0A6N9TFB3_9ALTE|nr:acyl-ACP--UDP-N-acetylglucosamine O-acyltransferase [Alteromonas sp.]MAI38538.1 acyl-[acyl-carrier-protein]--UDP-N-acetylglucosamine O-acyltransferase [Alteromonas sp.]MDY6885247.1 acyl-ACP--UDP-N-acetylglucosamine O-acyltransferase [Pseudomonadota bacterium]NDW14626.1 acyl-ACP--UDP-N-acetylglucosamine O-acyltransferase [Alteromonas genovensis]OUX85814.1 MAG: acyl-[acyl-carrier-protein]--UDP-N-acetylglucosamine O-acyltransferase [Alteromonas sp. TMED35]
MIHPTAVISESATIGENVTIGPFCVVDDNVTIGDGCILKSHVVVRGTTRIGKNNKFFQFSSIGEDCQDKKYAGEPTELIIGDDNEFREGVTVHRGTVQDEGVTIIGSRGLFMVNAHIAHDCVLGDDIIVANNCAIAGHVHIDDFVIVGGAVGIHQFCKIGAHAFLGAGGIILRDVPPFVMVSGHKNIPQGINSEGLKRRGFEKDEVLAIKRAYKVIYRAGNTIEEAIDALETPANDHNGVARMVEFLRHAERGIIR